MVTATVQESTGADAQCAQLPASSADGAGGSIKAFSAAAAPGPSLPGPPRSYAVTHEARGAAVIRLRARHPRTGSPVGAWSDRRRWANAWRPPRTPSERPRPWTDGRSAKAVRQPTFDAVAKVGREKTRPHAGPRGSKVLIPEQQGRHALNTPRARPNRIGHRRDFCAGVDTSQPHAGLLQPTISRDTL